MRRTGWTTMGLLALVHSLIGMGCSTASCAEALPDLQDLIAQTRAREQALPQCYEATLSSQTVNPDGTVVSSLKSRWTRVGRRRSIHFEMTVFSDPPGEMAVSVVNDGQTVRQLTGKNGIVCLDEWRLLKMSPYVWGPLVLLESGFYEGVRETVGSFLARDQWFGEDMEAHPKQFKIVGRERIEGVSTILVEVSLSGSSIRDVKRFYLAENFGYAPARVESAYGDRDPSWRTTMYDFERLPGGAWYAKRLVHEIFQGKQRPQQTVSWRFESVAWPERIDDSAFVLAFPAGTHVFDLVAGIDYTAGGAKPTAGDGAEP